MKTRLLKRFGASGCPVAQGGLFLLALSALMLTASAPLCRVMDKIGTTHKSVLPESMNTSAVRQKSVESEIIIVPSMHERKKTMYAMGDAYIAMPGGIGTMEELCEIYTWRQLRYHSKNIGLLNTAGYWDPFIAMLDRGVHDGFISEAVRNIIIAEEDPERLIDRLGSENSPLPPKF